MTNVSRNSYRWRKPIARAEDKMEWRYQLDLPGGLYRSIKALDAFHDDDSPEEERARVRFEEAEIRTFGRGTKALITGTNAEMKYILRRLRRIEDEARAGVITFEYLGVTRAVMYRVARQYPENVGLITDPECST